MRVNEDRALCAGHFPFAVHSGRRVWRRAFKQARIQPALLHHLDDERRVLADVFGVGGDVWNRKECGELLQNLMFVCACESRGLFPAWFGPKAKWAEGAAAKWRRSIAGLSIDSILAQRRKGAKRCPVSKGLALPLRLCARTLLAFHAAIVERCVNVGRKQSEPRIGIRRQKEASHKLFRSASPHHCEPDLASATCTALNATGIRCELYRALSTPETSAAGVPAPRPSSEGF